MGALLSQYTLGKQMSENLSGDVLRVGHKMILKNIWTCENVKTGKNEGVSLNLNVVVETWTSARCKVA